MNIGEYNRNFSRNSYFLINFSREGCLIKDLAARRFIIDLVIRSFFNYRCFQIWTWSNSHREMKRKEETIVDDHEITRDPLSHSIKEGQGYP